MNPIKHVGITLNKSFWKFTSQFVANVLMTHLIHTINKSENDVMVVTDEICS
jgi:hypothetical protein